ncbi:MAG: hypothetical protein HY261_02365 [Chloroflexi bacterium]|nr:hypothetical protein [Chloroflexota bacterium]
MVIDLTGGLNPAVERTQTASPADPTFREGMSFWINDDQGRFALPRMGIEADGKSWALRAEHVNIAFPDGRALEERGKGTKTTAAGPGGDALTFRCLDPFKRWSVSFHGMARDATAKQQLAGSLGDGPKVQVDLELEATMAAPPWIQGTMSEDAKRLMANEVEGKFMGGDRYEQLCRCKGMLRVGSQEYSFTGTGLRILRRGVRQMVGWHGHCWQSAIFPSGRGFGYICFPPRPDGTRSYDEGFLLEQGRLIPARVVEAPWLTDLRPAGGKASVVLESARGRTRIEGETVASTFHMMDEWDATGRVVPGRAMPLQQGMARYRLDGEIAYGMIERSYPQR